jgi:transposase
MDDVMPKPRSESEILPNPQNDRRQRRRFSADEKLRILCEADSCSERGELAALLRHEGLYSSLLQHWRSERDRGALQGLSGKRAGRKPQLDAKDRRIAQLERDKAKLSKRLDLAQKVISLQEKAHEILGLALPRIEDE